MHKDYSKLSLAPYLIFKAKLNFSTILFASCTHCLAPLLPWIFLQQEVPNDPEEAARLQQLQAAAAQWQHVQQQRAAFQYQALMQQHEKLQQILEKYQQLIQQSTNVQVGNPLFIHLFIC